MSTLAKNTTIECKFCAKHNIVVLEFGNIMLKFDEDAFYSFKDCITSLKNESRANHKSYLKLSNFPIQLSFTNNDLTEMVEVLDESGFYLNCLRILNR